MAILAGFSGTEALRAQTAPDPKGAFLRSMLLPGWGHYYTDKENWRRGQVHLGTEALLIGAFFGLHARSGNLENQFMTLSKLRAGVDLSGRDRSFLLAVGDFGSLEEYNDYQLRTRNWNRLIEDIPENRWHWANNNDRASYRDLRSGADRIRNQLPAIVGLMVANRLISGLSAYNRARKELPEATLSLLPVLHENNTKGALANMKIWF